MKARTEKFMGKELRYYPVLGSTNEKARELAAAGVPSGTVILAEEQTEGRGRLGRDWYSPPGSGLWFSLLLRPEIEPAEAPLLTIAAALALEESLQAGLSLKVQLKWPNDVLCRGKKLAGILAELVTGAERIKYAVLGIGVNVNQEGFPEELAAKATSLRLLLEREIERIKLLQGFLSSFDGFYQQILAGMRDDLIDRWKASLNIIGEEVSLYSGERVYRGRVRDISRQGELIIEDSSGGVLSFWAGDVSLR